MTKSLLKWWGWYTVMSWAYQWWFACGLGSPDHDFILANHSLLGAMTTSLKGNVFLQSLWILFGWEQTRRFRWLDFCGALFSSSENRSRFLDFLSYICLGVKCKIKSKVCHRSLNLIDCVIPVPKLVNRLFRSSNLFGCVIPVTKLINHLFRSSNLSSRVIPVPKFGFDYHLNPNRTI